jgi:hypothetical protein
LVGQTSPNSQWHQTYNVILYGCAWISSAHQFPRMRQVGRQNQNDYYQDMLDEVLACGLKSAMVSLAGNLPYVRPRKYSMNASAKLDIPDDGLAQAIRSCEALSDVA